MESGPALTRDAYEYLTNFADDRTILSMLSVNKQFNEPIFFQRVFDRKYPLLKEFKTTDESWRRFYVRMTYYIAKLEERFGIPYIPTIGYNPQEFYTEWKNEKDDKRIFLHALLEAAQGGHLKIVKFLIDKIEKKADDENFRGTALSMAMYQAVREGRLEIIKFLTEEKSFKVLKGIGQDYIKTAAENGHLKIVKYLINNGIYEEEKFFENLNWAIKRAAWGGHTEIVDYLKKFVQ